MPQTSKEFTLYIENEKGVETEICKYVIYDQEHCLVFITRGNFPNPNYPAEKSGTHSPLFTAGVQSPCHVYPVVFVTDISPTMGSGGVRTCET
jgi:hypothetical protein